jgi:hypothetical protein
VYSAQIFAEKEKKEREKRKKKKEKFRWGKEMIL